MRHWYLIYHTQFPSISVLTHWGQVTHICVSNLISAGILSIGTLGTNFSEFLIEILKFSFKNMRLKVLSGKWQPFCLSPNVLSFYAISVIFLCSCQCLYPAWVVKYASTFYHLSYWYCWWFLLSMVVYDSMYIFVNQLTITGLFWWFFLLFMIVNDSVYIFIISQHIQWDDIRYYATLFLGNSLCPLKL